MTKESACLSSLGSCILTTGGNKHESGTTSPRSFQRHLSLQLLCGHVFRIFLLASNILLCQGKRNGPIKLGSTVHGAFITDSTRSSSSMTHYYCDLASICGYLVSRTNKARLVSERPLMAKDPQREHQDLTVLTWKWPRLGRLTQTSFLNEFSDARCHFFNKRSSLFYSFRHVVYFHGQL